MGELPGILSWGMDRTWKIRNIPGNSNGGPAARIDTTTRNPCLEFGIAAFRTTTRRAGGIRRWPVHMRRLRSPVTPPAMRLHRPASGRPAEPWRIVSTSPQDRTAAVGCVADHSGDLGASLGRGFLVPG